MDFFTAFGFTADVCGFAALLKMKLKKTDSDWKSFLEIIRKVVNSACNDYRNYIEISSDHKDIKFPDEYENLLCDSIIFSLEQNSVFNIMSVLPMEKEFPKGEKERLFDILRKRLNNSFEYAMRLSSQNIEKQLEVLHTNVGDSKLLLQKIQNEIAGITPLVQASGHTSIRIVDYETQLNNYSRMTIWEASKRDYLASRSEGSRFANLNILSGLLPHGYVVHADFTEYGMTDIGEIKPLFDIVADSKHDHISIVGQGGIGKTTFLLKMMEKTYEKKYDEKAVIPIFIELNRCPPQIGDWYTARSQRTNFITRYIASQLLFCEIEDVPSSVSAFVETELNKRGNRDCPQYLILLDGFNEVNRGPALNKNGVAIGSSIRDLLNNEIKALMRRPNVRIITTSRKMDMAYFSGMTKNIELTGVKTEDIENHLRENHFTEMEVKSIKSSRKLMDCLKIPLFLCMFTAGGNSGEERPITRGEILYRFFNHSLGTYNEKLNAERINQRSTMDMTQMLFILDFVLPYVGQMMEYGDRFSLSKQEILEVIDRLLDGKDEKINFWNTEVIAFPEYETESRSLNEIKESLKQSGSSAVLDCIVNTLGIMYHDKRDKQDTLFKYYFIHHHVRDYFAGMYEVQRMRMAVAFRDSYMDTNRQELIDYAFDTLKDVNEDIWNDVKQIFVGEIVSEHRNAPVMRESGSWELPPPVFKEQHLLKSVLDVYRKANGRIYYGVYNIVETMKKVRINLAGEDFSGLDLTQCRFHGTACSIGRGPNRLSANFSGAVIDGTTFDIEGHCGYIIKFVYSKIGTSLFTISEDGTAKHWEVETGKCLHTVRVLDWEPFHNEEAANNFIISTYEDCFLVQGFTKENEDDPPVCFVQECGFTSDTRTIYTPDEDFPSVRSMRYSAVGNCIVAVFSADIKADCLYTFEQGKPKHIHKYKMDSSDSIVTAIMISEDEILMFCCDAENLTYLKNDTVVNSKCYIGILNVKTSKLEIVHSYTAEIDKAYGDLPVFCVNSKGDRIAFLDGRYIKEFIHETREITSINRKPGDQPLYMSYMDADDDFVMVAFDNAAFIYDLKGRQKPLIYEQENLSFQIYGVCSWDKFLLIDEMLDFYEWDAAKDTTQLKYRNYELIANAVFSNSSETEVIVSFDNDSAVILDAGTGELIDAICIIDRLAKVGVSLYDRSQNMLIALLESDQYETILCYDILTGESRRSYFDFIERQKICSLATSAHSDYLLCGFDKKVSETDLCSFESYDIYIADENEKVLSAQYIKDRIIQIVLCENYQRETNNPDEYDFRDIGKPYVYEYIKTGIGQYRKSAAYEPPYIAPDLIQYFAREKSGTYGIENKSENVFLCLCSGIFTKWNDALAAALTVDMRLWDGDGHESIVKRTPQANDTFIVCHDQSITLEMILLNNSDDLTLSMVHGIESGKLTVLKRDRGQFSKIGSIDMDDKMLEYCTSDSDKILFCVSDGTNIFSADLKSGAINEFQSYIPGLVIIGCDFKGAEMNSGVRHTLAVHGGLT